MASLRENRLLCYSLLAAVTMVFLLASGLMPELSEYLEVVEFPSEVTIVTYIQILIAKLISLTLHLITDKSPIVLLE